MAARCAASVVAVREAYVRKEHGEAAVKRLHDAASPMLRLALAAGRRGEGWVDFDNFVEATTLVDTLFGKGDLSLAWAVGRFGAQQNPTVLRHLFMRVVSPKNIIDVAGALWHHHYDSGRLGTRALGEHALAVELAGFARPHRTLCMSMGGWMESMLQQKRTAGPVVVRERACRTRGGASCEFVLSWAGAPP